MIIEIKDRLEKSQIKVPLLWRDSKHEKWFNNSNASKGAHGAYAYKIYLENKGYEVRKVSDSGDIEYKWPSLTEWIKAEVKASKVDLKVLKRPIGFVKEELWFNQLRPIQKGWDEAVLVGCYPNHIRIWRMSRKDFDAKYRTMSSTKDCLSHVGTNELVGVSLVKNTKKNNFHEWECIHNDQVGKIL